MPEMIRAADVAALLNHAIETACGECREYRKRLPDKWQVGINARGAGSIGSRQACLAQNTFNTAVMDMQLPRNGADAPFLNVVIPQDIGFEFRGHAHDAALSDQIYVMDDVSDSAGSFDARIAIATHHRNGSAMATAMRFPHTTSEWLAVNHLRFGVGNPDASLLFAGHGNRSGVLRVCSDQPDSFDSVVRPIAWN